MDIPSTDSPEQAQEAVVDAGVVQNAPSNADVPVRTLEDGDKIPYEVLQMIPVESAEHYHIAPLAMVDGVLEVGMLDTDDLTATDALNFITRKTGVPYKIFRISEDDFASIISMYEGLGGEVGKALSDLHTKPKEEGSEEVVSSSTASEPLNLDVVDGIGKAGADTGAPVGKDGEINIQEDAPAIKLASTILRYAIDGKASDIHIEPTMKGVRVRYRVDGTLHTSVVLPISVHRALVARIKVLSAIRLDEQRKPQDGRFSAEIEGRKIDFRVSTFPSYYGEKIVIRILDREEGLIPLDDIGMPDDMLKLVREALNQPHGLILISGPTGSGKSTTLYSMLAELNRDEKNVLSLEDPIEYNMEGVIQSQVRPEIGYTFANGLRTTLRQDPDIIMVGEIRDGETAKLAIQAALTGHLVLSTIHTNSAIGTIPRLIDMGVEPYLIPPTLILSMAQRLVRRLCPDGGEELPMSDSVRNMLERDFQDLPKEKRPEIPKVIYEAKSTSQCPNGTRGRRAVFETLPMTPSIEKVVLDRPIESEIWKVARKEGMMTMKEDAAIKSFARTVPFAEVNLLGSSLMGDEIEAELATDAAKALADAPPEASADASNKADATKTALDEGDTQAEGTSV